MQMVVTMMIMKTGMEKMMKMKMVRVERRKMIVTTMVITTTMKVMMMRMMAEIVMMTVVRETRGWSKW